MQNGITLSYTYDKAGRVSSFDNGFGKTSYEYDLLDRVTRVVDRNGKATVYEYDAAGNRSAVRYPNGTVMSYTYDACQPQGGNADLLTGPLALSGPTAVLGGLGPDLLDSLEEHMGGSAGGIHLPVVVDLQDLNIRLRESGGGLLGQTAQHRDA